MADVKFYLKWQEPESQEESLVFLWYYTNSFRLKFYSGVKIHTKYWNPETFRARKNYEGAAEFNQYLDSLEKELKKIVQSSKANGIPVTNDLLKEGLRRITKSKTETDETGKKLGFFDAFNLYLQTKKGKYSANYLRGTTTLRNHLLHFEKNNKRKITFAEIDFSFYEQFTSYLYNDLKQLNNTVGTNISRLKNFLKWSTAMKFNSSTFYTEREFKAMKSETEKIYLTEEEIIRIRELDLSNNKKLHNIRETFCFGWYTGLRFSDISAIRPINVKDDELNITSQKTKDHFTHHLNEVAISILKKNNFHLPVISNQKTNDYLKELGKLAGLNETFKITKFRGQERIEIEEPKYQFITTHTARRSYITVSLEKGMRPEIVMEQVNHKNYRSFKKYIVLTDKVKKSEMKRIWNREPEQTMKAV